VRQREAIGVEMKSLVGGAAVEAVAEDWMAERSKVHAELMGTAGLELECEGGELLVVRERLVMAERGVTVGVVFGECAPPTGVMRVAADAKVDVSGEVEVATDECDIAAVDAAVHERGLEGSARAWPIGEEHQTGGVAVQAVQKASIREAGGNLCVKGGRRFAGRGLRQSAAGFVGDYEPVVCVDDCERRESLGVGRFREKRRDAGAG
jgi:hypothetical protein